jgi:hypothetical protein
MENISLDSWQLIYQLTFLWFDFIRSMSLQLSPMQFMLAQIWVCTFFKIRQPPWYRAGNITMNQRFPILGSKRRWAEDPGICRDCCHSVSVFRLFPRISKAHWTFKRQTNTPFELFLWIRHTRQWNEVFCEFFNEIGFGRCVKPLYSVLCHPYFTVRSFFVPFSWINVR